MSLPFRGDRTIPIPKLMAKVNKRVFNKYELSRGSRPVLSHVGRLSGATYETPLDAHPVENGYIFILMYGSDSDWVQKILTAGSATLLRDGSTIELTAPRLISESDAWGQLPPTTQRPAGFLNVTEFLQMDIRSQTDAGPDLHPGA